MTPSTGSPTRHSSTRSPSPSSPPTSGRSTRRSSTRTATRGHADRDFFYDPRKENPALDYRAFAAFLNADGAPPTDRAAQLVRQREALTADVVEGARRTAFGSVKADVFKIVLDYCHRFLIARGDQRHFVDRYTFSKTRALREMGRRLIRDETVSDPTDFYFLSKRNTTTSCAVSRTSG